jgi:replicative DNA helicase
VFAISEQGARGRQGLVEIRPIIAQVVERIDQLHSNPSEVTGTPTGYTRLDQMTSGLQPGDLIIVAGRPSMGKTAFALNIAEHLGLVEQLPVAVFSMEMSGTQLVMRMIGSVARVDQLKVRTGRIADEEWPRLTEAWGRLNEAPLYIDETPALNSLELRARARRLHRQVGGPGLGLIVIDYLQLMSATGQGENRATEISEISRSLKALAKELSVPVIALSQLNRSLEQRPNKRPVMSDLRESGAIEQDADVILFIYRDEVYNPDSADKGVAEIIIGKQRNGPIGMVKMTFLGQFTRFENYADPDRY